MRKEDNGQGTGTGTEVGKETFKDQCALDEEIKQNNTHYFYRFYYEECANEGIYFVYIDL